MSFKQKLNEKVLVGMVHTRALPGTPGNRYSCEEIIDIAIGEAKALQNRGFDTVLIENMFDIPYTKQIRPEVVSTMAIIGHEIKKLGLYCGIQILAAGNIEAMAVSKAANLDFIRCEGFVYGHMADEGYIESCAGELLRYRKSILAEDVLIFTDIKKKHSSHSLTADIDIVETAKTAEYFLSDGNIITGTCTGLPADPEEVRQVKENTSIPTLIGSGLTDKNLKEYFAHADVFIVGSHLKEEGKWNNWISYNRIDSIVNQFNELRKSYNHHQQLMFDL